MEMQLIKLQIQDYCMVSDTLKKWAESIDPLLGNMAVKMKAKHDKYWGNNKNTNMVIFIAVVLDPRYKLRFVQWSFGRLYEKDDAEFLGGKVKATFNVMFDSYRPFRNNDYVTNYSHSSHDEEMVEVGAFDNLSFAMEFEKDINVCESMNKNEVDLYLMEGLEKSACGFDILNWRKVNSTKYPILAQIARDVLAMAVFTVASESAFSTGGRVLSNYRNSLSPKTVEALICVQNWFRSTSMPIDIEECLEDLEKLELELAPTTTPNEEDSGEDSD